MLPPSYTERKLAASKEKIKKHKEKYKVPASTINYSVPPSLDDY